MDQNPFRMLDEFSSVADRGRPDRPPPDALRILSQFVHRAGSSTASGDLYRIVRKRTGEGAKHQSQMLEPGAAASRPDRSTLTRLNRPSHHGLPAYAGRFGFASDASRLERAALTRV